MYELKSDCGLTMTIDEVIGEASITVKSKDGETLIIAYLDLDSFQDRGVIEGVLDKIKRVEIEKCMN